MVWLLVQLVAFSVLVGPVAWWRFIWRARRVEWFVGAVLLLSGTASTLLVLTATAHSGLRPWGQTARVRVVDQAHDVELEVVEAYAMVPSWRETRVLAHPEPERAAEAAVKFHPIRSWRMGDWRRTYRNVTWLDDFNRVNDPLVPPAGVPLWVGSVRVGPGTGRLVVSREAGQRVVENQLGAEIESLALWVDGQAYGAFDVRAGAQAVLVPLDDVDGEHWPAQPYISQARVGELIEDVWQLEARDRFVAVLAHDSRLPRLLSGGIGRTGGALHADVVAGLL